MHIVDKGQFTIVKGSRNWHISLHSLCLRAKTRNAYVILGSLRSYDGCYSKSVKIKQDFVLGSVFCDYSMLVTMHKIGNAHFRLFGMNCFRVETENTRFTAGSSPCCQKVKYREVKQPRRRRQQERHKFAYLTMKNTFLHALHVHFSYLDILKTLLFFLRREMTCFAVVWATWG